MLSSIARRLADMDRMGIDVQAVSPSPNQTYYWAEPGLGLELARQVNDRLAGIVAEHPRRFVALGTVPLQDVELAVAELERCVKELGFRGVEINPNVNGAELTDPRLGLEKFFARVEELGVVVFMHPLGFTQGERLVDHYFNNVIGNPLETTVAASHLIFDGVMERHPKLKIVLPHGGGYLAHYWARMDHAHRMRPDCRTVIRKRPSSYLARMHFDTITFDPGMLRALIERFGARHVVLGTDYPYDMMETDPVGLIAKRSAAHARRAGPDRRRQRGAATRAPEEEMIAHCVAFCGDGRWHGVLHGRAGAGQVDQGGGVPRAGRGAARRRGQREDVRVLRARPRLEAHRHGVRVRSGDRQVDEEEAHAARIAPRRLHRDERQDLRVRRIRAAGIRPARVGADRQCLGVRPRGRYVEGARAHADQARLAGRGGGERKDLRDRWRHHAAQPARRHRGASRASARRGGRRRGIRSRVQHLESAHLDAHAAQPRGRRAR